jgi:hypothetical protein
VVGLDEDLPRLRALVDNPIFATRRAEPPFVLWTGPPAVVPEQLEPGRWRIALATERDGWVSAALAYYPLWRAAAGGRPLPTRRGSAGELEVQLPAGRTVVDLTYGPGAAEWTGLALTALGLVIWMWGAPKWPPTPLYDPRVIMRWRAREDEDQPTPIRSEDPVGTVPPGE